MAEQVDSVLKGEEVSRIGECVRPESLQIGLGEGPDMTSVLILEMEEAVSPTDKLDDKLSGSPLSVEERSTTYHVSTVSKLDSMSPINEMLKNPELEDLDSFNLIEPPPLDWRSDSSSEAGSLGEIDDPSSLHTDSTAETPEDRLSEFGPQDISSRPAAVLVSSQEEHMEDETGNDSEGPQDPGPESEQPQDPGPESERPQDPGPESELTQDPGLESERPQDPGPESEQPQDPGPESELTQDPGLESERPQDPGPESELTQDPGLESERPQDPGPESERPQDPGPKSERPQDPGLESERPQDPGPESERPQDHGSEEVEKEARNNKEVRRGDVDHSHIQSLLTQLQLFNQTTLPDDSSLRTDVSALQPCTTGGTATVSGLLFTESHQRDLLGLLEVPGLEESQLIDTCAGYIPQRGDMDAVVSVSYSQEDGERYWDHQASNHLGYSDEFGYPGSEVQEHVWQGSEEQSSEEESASKNTDTTTGSRPAYKDVPGPCDPDDLLDGVIFGAKYLGSTQLKTEKNPSTNARMAQAQEAVDRIKAPEGESQPMTEVDLFISTQRIKVLSADTQEAMMDHPLQMISYIADIGNIVVLMARRKLAGRKGVDGGQAASPPGQQKKCCMICHVFSSEDAQTIAQAIGQAFGVAYQQFLHANGIKASELRPSEYSDYLGTQELYNGDLVHFSQAENIREVCISKESGEILGLAVVESGWGSILPTVVVANLLHGGPAERSGELSIGDRIMSVNGTSLVGLPIATCHSIIRDLKNQTQVKLSIVHCPPVTMAIIKRPDPKYQLGFSVEDGIICSLMRGGIAERGGIRVGHRIIEINGQSVVATPHEKIIHILTNAVGEIHLKTMPASTYRLLTGQEQPVFL